MCGSFFRCLGIWFSDRIGSAGLVVGLNDLREFFQPWLEGKATQSSSQPICTHLLHVCSNR